MNDDRIISYSRNDAISKKRTSNEQYAVLQKESFLIKMYVSWRGVVRCRFNELLYSEHDLYNVVGCVLIVCRLMKSFIIRLRDNL